jgi:hypothetical protein
MLDATTIDPIIQMVINVLGCQGVGGAAALALAVAENSGASLTTMTSGNLSNLTSSLGYADSSWQGLFPHYPLTLCG